MQQALKDLPTLQVALMWTKSRERGRLQKI
jgi:hypothetical protein